VSRAPAIAFVPRTESGKASSVLACAPQGVRPVCLPKGGLGRRGPSSLVPAPDATTGRARSLLDAGGASTLGSCPVRLTPVSGRSPVAGCELVGWHVSGSARPVHRRAL
jgi:hypothetical protein